MLKPGPICHSISELNHKETCWIFALSMNLFMSHFSIYSLAVKLKMTHPSGQSALIFCLSSDHSKLLHSSNLSSYNYRMSFICTALITACPLSEQFVYTPQLSLSLSLKTRGEMKVKMKAKLKVEMHAQ